MREEINKILSEMNVKDQDKIMNAMVKLAENDGDDLSFLDK